MPGRRYPRRSQQETSSSHVQAIFPGGLNGASTIPYPVGVKPGQDGANGKCPQVLFFNEEFIAGWGAKTFTLTYLPITHSEHVFLCRGLYGTYQREEVAWTREGGSKTLNVLVGMNTQPGDTIVVEYAHYEQAPTPVPAKCGKMYEPIVLRTPDTLTYGGLESLPSARALWLPAAEGFPVVLSTSNPSNLTAPDAWGAYHLASTTNSIDEYTMSVGPGLAPGSSHSRQVAIKSLQGGVGSTIGVEHNMSIYCGNTNPRWSEATHINMSAYYASTGINPARFQAGAYLGFATYWPHNYNIIVGQNDTAPRTWFLQYQVNHPTGNIADTITLPVSLGDNWTPGTHFIGFEFDMVTASIKITGDTGSYTYQNPALVPDFSIEKNNTPFRPKIETYMGQLYGTNGIGTTTTNSVDALTFSSDVPYCIW